MMGKLTILILFTMVVMVMVMQVVLDLELEEVMESSDRIEIPSLFKSHIFISSSKLL